MIKFKVCCIRSVKEAELAIRYGASAIGLVSAMPSGPGPIPEEKIAEIAATVPSYIDTFLLTSLQRADEIIEQHRRCGTTTIQIVDELLHGTYDDIRSALPEIKIVQVLHVGSEKSIEEARGIAPRVDAILLDSGNPTAKVKTLGGTGNVHDWDVSRRIVESVSVPVYLAGGLNPGNAAEAIRTVQPFALDICSGLRTDDQLDEEKLRAFVDAIKSY